MGIGAPTASGDAQDQINDEVAAQESFAVEATESPIEGSTEAPEQAPTPSGNDGGDAR